MSHKILDNNLVAIGKRKLALKFNNPASIEIFILDLSKIFIYEFHYDCIKNEYGNKSKLIFTETDSLMYEIKTEDVHDNFRSNKEIFDFSNYSTKSKYYDDSHKLVIGKMKDETRRVVIEEFVGLKPSMYSFLVDSNEHKKSKRCVKMLLQR